MSIMRRAGMGEHIEAADAAGVRSSLDIPFCRLEYACWASSGRDRHVVTRATEPATPQDKKRSGSEIQHDRLLLVQLTVVQPQRAARRRRLKIHKPINTHPAKPHTLGMRDSIGSGQQVAQNLSPHYHRWPDPSLRALTAGSVNTVQRLPARRALHHQILGRIQRVFRPPPPL